MSAAARSVERPTLLLTSTTVASGRATVLQGAVHLVVFAVFLFLAMVP